MGGKEDPCWRKSKLAARILVRKEQGRMNDRDRRLAKLLANDRGVTNRLIDQGYYVLIAKEKAKNARDKHSQSTH